MVSRPKRLDCTSSAPAIVRCERSRVDAYPRQHGGLGDGQCVTALSRVELELTRRAALAAGEGGYDRAQVPCGTDKSAMCGNAENWVSTYGGS